MDLNNKLRGILDSDRILDGELWREIYARDASYFRIKPKAIVRPRTVDEIAKLLDLAKDTGIGVTFRAGGTSLSGQTVNNGIICEIRTDWTDYEIRDNGRKVWFEPGVTADQINSYLRPHHTHIGPDPASSTAAMMGGILSNNSSGMHAGVEHNSYHTLSSIRFMLANGHIYDSSILADRQKFEETERNLCAGLMDIRSEIMSNRAIREKIIRKYQIKNVTGYAMNAFVDFDNPMDIFTHTLIGSEGTLAYIISAELKTLPLFSTYSSCMLYFPDVTSAAASAAWLGEKGAIAVELMDYASIVSYMGKQNDMPQGTTAMLVDFGAGSPEEMDDMSSRLAPEFKSLRGLSRMEQFTHTVAERAALWKMRDGIFPCVAGARTPGATVILEDVASQVGDLDRLVDGVQSLFKKYGYAGAIFGHARDGNIHPMLTSTMENEKETLRFKNFMDDLVAHVISLEGSLKGEHGTGRAIAPFVEREWGPEIYSLMKRLKQLADPDGILNPGVIINDDPDCFIGPMKQMTLFGKKLGYEQADKCMECGYCEHVCPTRNITLTPRQRLQALRVISETGSDSLKKQYKYIGEETCCSDGSCQMPCPMQISTAEVTDCIRRDTDPRFYEKLLSASAGEYGKVESSIRGLLKMAVATEKVISPYPLIWATDLMHRIYNQVPHWSKHFPFPAKLHWNECKTPDYIYFPACVTRIFGGSSLGKDDLVTVILRIAEKAGFKVALPKEMHGLCCSQIWQHKGDPQGQAIIANKTVEKFYELSDSGRIPIFCDTTSCTHTLLHGMKGALSEENKVKFSKLRIMDITEWLAGEAMPRLTVTTPKRRVLLHPTCASRLLNLQQTMLDVAKKCAVEVIMPANCQCCGAAGDRGFIYPEVARSATAPEKREIDNMQFDGCYSLARTCEISMMDTIDRPYESLAYLVDETIA
ncbi:MAG: FAD-binding oxidoreductase [Muribaculum sp.]|nr:FAD-binding oxidoreductase [Muribaculum sp.]